MSKFTASNGISVEINDDERITFQIDGVPTSPIWLSPGEMIALREYAIAEEDKRLGRWRWPENPDYVVYPVVENPNAVRVIVESTSIAGLYYRGNGWDRTTENRAAEAFFDAHPEPKPWHDARPGEVWELTVAGVASEVAAYVAYEDRFIHVERQRLAVDKEAAEITGGRRIWPEGASS